MRDVAYRSSAAANVTKMITAAAVVIHCRRVIVLAPLLSAQRKRGSLFRDTGSNHPQKSGPPQSGKLLYRFHRNGGMGLLVFALSLVCFLFLLLHFMNADGRLCLDHPLTKNELAHTPATGSGLRTINVTYQPPCCQTKFGGNQRYNKRLYATAAAVNTLF